jgi:hypothetical protein
MESKPEYSVAGVPADHRILLAAVQRQVIGLVAEKRAQQEQIDGLVAERDALIEALRQTWNKLFQGLFVGGDYEKTVRAAMDIINHALDAAGGE